MPTQVRGEGASTRPLDVGEARFSKGVSVVTIFGNYKLSCSSKQDGYDYRSHFTD